VGSGIRRTRDWYHHLDGVDLANMLSIAAVTPSSFRKLHEKEVESLGIQSSWAAKMSNIRPLSMGA
jgi:hypothetical protein